MNAIDAVAERLVGARVPGAPRVVPDAGLPDGRDGAYRVRAAVAARLGPVGAFKCGRRAPDAVPKLAPVYAADVHDDGAR